MMQTFWLCHWVIAGKKNFQPKSFRFSDFRCQKCPFVYPNIAKDLAYGAKLVSRMEMAAIGYIV